MPFWRRQPEERTLTAVNLQPAYLPADSSTIRPSTALANPDVYACTRVLADAAASCPLVTYRRLGDGNRRRLSNHTAELLRNPAEGPTQANLVSTLVAHLCLWGNAYLGKYRDPDGRVEQLLPIAPDRVTVERRSGRIVFTVSDERGRQSEHTLDDVIHVKALGTDGLVGLSPIRQMRQALELNTAVRTAATALFKNGARPSGILKLGHSSNPDSVEALKSTWTNRHSGESQGSSSTTPTSTRTPHATRA